MNRDLNLRSSPDLARLHARWRSEYGPAAHSEAETLAALADVEKDIEDCDAEVDRLQSLIIFVQTQRRRLEEYKICLRFLRSPIRNFPNETLLRIFDFACDVNELTSGDLKTMPALAISSVCARWRNLAKDHPVLWSRISMNMESTPHKHPNLPILNLYLEYSRQSPLIVNLDGDIEPGAVRPDHSTMCVTLFKHANHLQQLRIQDYFIEAVLSHNESPHFPILEKLHFPSFLFQSSSCLDSYQIAPTLSRLSLGAFPWRKIGESKFPWKQLTTLSICGHPEGMKCLLETCCKLTELRLEEYDNSRYSQQCTPPATAPVLEALSLTLSPTSLLEGLAEIAFSSLTCPSLTSLVIEVDDHNYKRPWPKECLCAFILRSSFNLTTLSLKFIPLSDSDLIDLLRDLPSLLHFTIHDHKIATPITPLLIHSLHAFPPVSCVASSSALVKKLQSFEMRFVGRGSDGKRRDFNDSDFVDMVSSRWFPNGHQAERYADHAVIDPNGMGTACLRSVVMRFVNRKVNQEIYKPLKYLEKAGMRVVIVGK